MKILILADIHGNLTALDAVLIAAGSFDEVWSLGDIVGYGPDPEACVNRLIEVGASPSLAGNHDLACLGELPITDFNAWAQAATRWTTARLSERATTYLRALPSSVVIDQVTLAHGSPRDPVWEYVSDSSVATVVFGHFDTPLCLVGHTHIAAVAEMPSGVPRSTVRRWQADSSQALDGGRLIVNPGSVGQPRDGDPRAAFAILDLTARTITSRRVAYDVAAVQARMRAAHLPELLVARIAVGF